MEHPFFDEIDPEDLWNKKYKPDYVPEISEDKYDLAHFDPEVTNLAAKESFVNEEEREDILKRVEEYKEEFKEIATNERY